tara:strand:- start:21985 stop:22866 length:882 start_codon:yes stop_codon:yes gene_type:complete
MADDSGAQSFAITEAGAIAFDSINFSSKGRVTALFERSFYIETEECWMCFGPDGLYLGPLNIRTNAPPTINWQASGLSVDDRVRASSSDIFIGNRFSFSYRDVVIWRPDPPPVLEKEKIRIGLSNIANIGTELAPSEGLAPYVFNTSDRSHILSNAKSAIGNLEKIFQRQDFERPVSLMIGLGPGLTPSGDDFLGGMMITLKILGEDRLQEDLTARIKTVYSATNEISRAHLDSAALGVGAEPLHAAIDSIISNNETEMADVLKRVSAIGHCSGWDALTGAVVTLRAWLAQES